MATDFVQARRPDNAPEELVYDYDLYEAPRYIASAYQVDLPREMT